MDDIRRQSLWYDAGIILLTIGMVMINVINLIFAGINKYHPDNYHFTKGHK